MPRAQDFFVLSRPGDGPLVVTLTGVLLINLTVLTVLVGYNDLKGDGQDQVRQAAAIPLQTGVVTPATRSTPIQPGPTKPANARPTAPRPAIAPPPAAIPQPRPEPTPIPSAPLTPALPSAADQPEPTPANAQPAAPAVQRQGEPVDAPEDAPRDAPITFFGVPAE